MDRPHCLGLLGLSGNYGAINFDNLSTLLPYALTHYDLVDLSSEYGIKFNLIDVIRQLAISHPKANYIYKVGCEYNEAYCVDDLIVRTQNEIKILGQSNIDSLLFHRPSAAKLDCDIAFFQAIRARYPDTPFGICTNDETVYNLYKDAIHIKIVQIAINALDYAKAEPFLQKVVRDGMTVQARSVLSSGLASGTYHAGSVFDDPMRSRYNEEHNKDGYTKRVETSLNIARYLCETYGVSASQVPTLLYCLFEQLPGITHVLRGGSTLAHLSDNLHRVPVDMIDLDNFILKMKDEWGCDYV